MDFGYVIKISENDYIVFVDLEMFGSGYNVVPKTIDSTNMYDVEDVKDYCLKNPSKVLTGHPLEEKERTAYEISKLKAYLSSTDYAVIKCQELGLDMNSEYPELMQKRAEARARINELEG